MKDKTVVKITPDLMAKIISEETGQKVTTETHWFRASMEATRELAPFSLMTIEAIKR